MAISLTITIPYPLLIFWYYVRCGFLTIFAYLTNRSFLAYHPKYIFPTIISPPWNHIIHSITPTHAMRKHLNQCYPPIPRLRRWLSPDDLQYRLRNRQFFDRAIILDGTLQGPPLRQGQVILIQNRLIYLQEEHGRWPSNDGHIAVTAINISDDISFILFLPAPLVDRRDLYDASPPSPFYMPILLSQYTSSREWRLRTHFP